MKLNKLKIGVGSLVGATILGITIPFVIHKHHKSDGEVIKKHQSQFQKVLHQPTIQATDLKLQKLFGLQPKTIAEVNLLKNASTKSQYDTIDHIGAYIFKHHNQKINLYYEAQNNNFKTRNFLIVFNKNQTNQKVKNDQTLASQHFDPTRDLFAMQGTLFKEQLIAEKILQGTIKPSLKELDSYSSKTFAFIKLLKIFSKQQKLNAKIILNKNQYNMASDSNSRVLEFIKAYLIGLVKDKSIKAGDLDPYVSFDKKGANHVDKNHGTGRIVFKYHDVVITKTISDFKYQQGYQISIVHGKEQNVADDVTKFFVDDSKLPSNVTVADVFPDPSRPDGSTVKVVYQGGKIKNQQLSGFQSYQAKGWSILNALRAKDFKQEEILKALVAKQDLKALVINAIKFGGYGQTPIKKVFKALITKVEYKQETNVLKINIKFKEQQKVLIFKYLNNIFYHFSFLKTYIKRHI